MKRVGEGRRKKDGDAINILRMYKIIKIFKNDF